MRAERTANPSASRRTAPELSLLLVAILAELTPLVALPHLVTVDGPAHLYGGWVLVHHGDPAISRTFVVDPFPSPNLATQLVLAGLIRVAPLDVADKVLAGAWFVLLPLALRYAVVRVNPRAGWLSFAAFPLTANYLFLYGFTNFCLGLGLLLLVIGFAVRHVGRWTPRSTCLFALLLLATYLAHLLPFLVAVLVVALLAVTDLAGDPGHPAASRGRARSRLVPPLLAVVPSAVLVVAFTLHTSRTRDVAFLPFLDRLTGLVSLSRILVVYDRREAVVSVALAGLLAVLVTLRARTSPPRGRPDAIARALGLALAATTLAALLSPQRYSPAFGFLTDRLAYFPVVLLLLWLAVQPPARPALRVTAVVTFLAAPVALFALRLPTELRYQRHTAEFLSIASAVPRGSGVVALRLWRDTPVGGAIRNRARDPLTHLAGAVAARAQAVDIGHYEAHYDYFPVQFRSSPSPRDRLDPSGEGLEQVPPRVDLAAATADVDVVLLVGRHRMLPSVAHAPRTGALLTTLGERYRLVRVSRPSGLVEVWVRRSSIS